jgi:hypothetical protein
MLPTLPFRNSPARASRRAAFYSNDAASGRMLHEFDIALCKYALNNIAGYSDRQEFRAYIEDNLDPSVLTYLMALQADESDPLPLLLAESDLWEISDDFDGGTEEFNKYWVSNERLHRSSMDCVIEIRDSLAPTYAEEWAKLSTELTKWLEREETRLSNGIYVIGEWVVEARRLLRAMGAIAFLPRPDGTFPTPKFPVPSASPVPAENGTGKGDTVVSAIAEIQTLQREVRDLLVSQRTVKDWYSTDEIASISGKAEYTVREWCRQGRIRAEKKGSGRGKYQSWVVSHDELLRYQRDGLLLAKH